MHKLRVKHILIGIAVSMCLYFICSFICDTWQKQQIVRSVYPYKPVSLVTFDVSNYGELLHAPCHRISGFDWSPDDEQIAVACGGTVLLYMPSDQSISVIKDDIPWALSDVSWNSDGSLLAISERELWVWDSVTKDFTPAPAVYIGDSSYEVTLWDSSGQYLATELDTWGEDVHYVWGVSDNTHTDIVVEGEEIEHLHLSDWSPDDRYFSIGSWLSTPVYIVDVISGKIIQTLDASLPAIWNPQGDLLATRSKNGKHIVVWNTSSWQPVTTLKGYSRPGIEWHPSGRYLAAVYDSGIAIWNINSNEFYYVQTEPGAIDWNSDGSQLAVVSDDIPLELGADDYYGPAGGILYIWDIDALP